MISLRRGDADVTHPVRRHQRKLPVEAELPDGVDSIDSWTLDT